MKQAFSFLLKAAISGLLLYFALRAVDFSALGQRIAALNPAWALLALAAMALQIALVALRWRHIAESAQAPLSAGDAVRFTYIGMFFNQTLPSTVGGDAARIWLLARAGGGWRGAAYSVLVDRAAGLIWLALIVLVCLPWSLRLIDNPVGQVTLAGIGAAGIVGPAGLFIVTGAARGLLQRWRPTQHLLELADLLRRVLLRPHPGVAVAALSVTVHLLTVLVTWLIANAIGSPFTLVQSLLLIPPVTLISAIPISIAGWGVREGAMVAAFTYAGLAAADGLAISVLFGVGLFIIGGAGGGLWLSARKA